MENMRPHRTVRTMFSKRKPRNNSAMKLKKMPQ